MKRSNLLLLICTFLLSILVSCSKSNDDTGPVTPPVTPNYSTTLMKVYVLDTTKQAPDDTLTRWFFFYDNSNRLTSDSLSGLSGSSIYTRIRTVQYNGTDTTASWSTSKGYTSPQNMSIDTTYYTFLHGDYVADTSVYYYITGGNTVTGTSKTSFSYQPGTIIRSFQNWVPQISYSGIETDTIHKTVVNGDIVEQADTLYSFANGQLSGSQVFQTTVSYLPNPNPFFKLSCATAKQYFAGVGIGNLINNQYTPAHLIAQQTSTVGDLTYEYTFREDGYPLTAKVSGSGNGGQTTKFIFVYAPN